MANEARAMNDAAIERARKADILAVAVNLLGVRGLKGKANPAGPCPRCGGDDRFGITRSKGLFNCRRCKVGGDVIDLVQFIRGGTVGEAASLINREARQRPSKRGRGFDATALVRGVLKGLQPLHGTEGERYLREERGIGVAAIEDMLAEPHAFGWNRAVYFHSPGHPLHRQSLGCIVGIMTDPITAQPTGAISRTYISPDGKKVGKAKSLGTGGGVVRLSRDDDVLSGLHVGEGIETCLAAASIGLRPILSTGSAATMAKLPVLDGVEALTIICDHDENGAGECAARELEARWLDADREARIIIRDKVGDINDAIREGAR
jgi:hypothetical protein